MYVATGIMNSCIFYVASMLPMEYINAIIIGNNLSGIFTSLISIISKATSPNIMYAAFFYFLSTFLMLTVGLAGYFVLHICEFFKCHLKDYKQQEQIKVSIFNREFLKQIWLLSLAIWVNFLSTLAIFPVYQLGIERSSENFFISEKWYRDVLTFLTFNIFVLIGNLLPKLFKISKKNLIFGVFLRAILVFIFFAMCNFKPNERYNIPVLFDNDYIYWVGAMLSPLTFGYFTSLLMMYLPQSCNKNFQGLASMVAALVLSIGVVSGLQFGQVFELIVVA
jgi:equilibrative nucleoside transporter 1/2/3